MWCWGGLREDSWGGFREDSWGGLHEDSWGGLHEDSWGGLHEDSWGGIREVVVVYWVIIIQESIGIQSILTRHAFRRGDYYRHIPKS